MAGCDGEPDHGHLVRYDSLGVQVLQYAADAQAPRWQVNSSHVVSAPGMPDGGFTILYQGAVATDHRGNIYVIDRATVEIHSFDSLGLHRWTYGTVGDGPGELRSPFTLSANAVGGAVVHDGRRRVLVQVSEEGAFSAEARFPHPVTSLRTPIVRVDSTGTYFWILSEYDGSEWRNLTLHRTEASDSLAILSLPWRASRTVHFPACGISLALPSLFSPDLIWHSAEGRAAIVNTHEYRIEILDKRGVIQSIRRRVEPAPTTQAEAESLFESGIQSPAGSCLRSAGDYVRAFGKHPWHQIVSGVTLSPDGMLWVEWSADGRGETRTVDVYDKEGVLTGTVPGNPPFPLAFLSPERYVAMSEDSVGLFHLHIVTVDGVP